MIAFIRGGLVSKSPTEVVIDCGGIGYAANIPLSTFEALGAAGTNVTLLTYLHVREDLVQLYGFASDEERAAFRLLLSVTGIGPRMAQGILSGIPVTELRQHLLAGNLGALTTIPGVGRKIAERLIVELRDKVAKMEPAASPLPGTGDPLARVRTEALLALASLGFSRQNAEKALRAALQESKDPSPSVELLIKIALRHASP